MSTPPIFSTKSVLLAAWLDYAHDLNLRFLRYDANAHLFHFWDPDNRAQSIIDGSYKLDPSVSLHKFERIRARLLADKMRADNARKAARRSR